ncbi:hypothetical protein TorRG33x02_259560 [Trema orientale]|uniref:Uncharacterized protein n=1 Tax=Trema orientale TaxID=63057 RepID=A0A2P5D7R1_TREOI|nr:hypothetical protein TorRG33x02_259560 [Trema orientale]
MQRQQAQNQDFTQPEVGVEAKPSLKDVLSDLS